jgi:signal transduction histidine kinase/ligand-binding sensor domain-containing protein
MQRRLLLSAYLFICTGCLAQLTGSGGQYPFVHYTPKDGLVNSRVRKAYQDSKGRMYFLTFGGLSVYDGARFKNYTMQNGLLTDLVNDVLEVGEDSLLVAVNGCGLNVLVHGQMKKLTLAGNVCPIINQFLKSNDGYIYATTDDGLYKLSSEGLQKIAVVIPPQKKAAVYLGVIVEYKDFFVFTTNDLRHYQGLFLYNKKTNTLTDFLPGLFIYSLKKDYTGVIWVGTDKTIAILDTLAIDKGKLELRKPYSYGANPKPFETGQINFNRDNELLIASGIKGITRYHKDGTRLYIASPEFSTTVVQNFFIDREGVIWICHDGNGVYKLSNTQLQSAVSYSYERRAGITMIRADSPDTCWVLTKNNQLLLRTSFGDKKFVIKSPVSAYTLFYNNNYLYAASAKQLFIAPMSAGSEKIIRFRQILSLPDTTLFGGRFVSDPYGNTILFEYRNICVFQNDKLLFRYPISSYDLIEGMYIARNNKLWLVSRGTGLHIFSLHPENPSRYLQKEHHFIKEFEGASPRWITVDKDERLWVGTRYHGLMAFEYKKNQLRKLYHFQTHTGLTDNFVTSLACDGNNNIIVGTQTGLDRLIKVQEGYRTENVTKSNNVFAYINYVWTDAGNNAFAWTNSGAVFRVEPAQTTIRAAEPQLLIEEIKVNGKVVPAVNSSLRLHHLQRNITFSVTAPSFIDEKQIKYSYLLTGGGNIKWSDTTAAADINLLNLSPGNYRLQVKAFFPSTGYSSKETAFSFTILPPWWKTWWFRIGIGIAGIGALISSIRFYYGRKLEKQKVILEKQQVVEKERTRIATDMHDDLGAGLSKIRFLSETVQRNISEEAHQPTLQNIASSSVELVDKFNEIIWAMNEKNNSLEDLLYYMRNYTAKYCEENNLVYSISIPGQIPSLIISGEMRRHIFLTVKESLHNVVKHAGAKNVQLRVELDTYITISIQDDGKGFAVAEMKNAGNGLRNMEQRMKNVNGKLVIVRGDSFSEKKAGTLVKIVVPFPAD